jgi:potassium-transporting ATPase KdpC subunit
MILITGIFYPLIMTGVAQVVFPKKSNGSMIIKNGKLIGSELIGQRFDSSIYFWSRPSSIDYNPVPSGASNLGPTSEKLKKQVADRRTLFASENSVTDINSIPKEMIFASGSGMDPHISPKAALLQIDRITKARNLSGVQKEKLVKLVKSMVELPQFGIFGESRVNVLKLNLAMDSLFTKSSN